MATVTTLKATAASYGRDIDKAYSLSASTFLFVGPSTYNYRSRLRFPALSSVAAIGNNAIAITKIVLHLRRDDGNTTLTAGASSSSAWGASTVRGGSGSISASTGWKTVDITAAASAIKGYSGNWYLHLTGSGGTRARFGGTDSSYVPYLTITWEYVANTIRSEQDEVELGSPARFTITPGASDASYTLRYSIGDSSGIICENSANTSITWTPPRALAAEIPDSESDTVRIDMQVYNSGGTLLRTERLYQTVTVPEDMLPAFPADGLGISVVDGLGGYALTNRSRLTLTPKVDMTGAYGATLRELRAAIENGSGQEIVWTGLSETDAGVFAGAQAASGMLASAGTARITLTATDSRGRSVGTSKSVTVCAWQPPQIGLFSVDRCEPIYDSDEQISGYAASETGGYVWVNLIGSCSSVAPAGAQLNSLKWTLEAKNLATGESVTKSGAGALNVALTDDRAVLPDPVAIPDSYSYTLTLTDAAGASVQQYAAVGPGRATLVLGPHGLAVGMFPNSSEDRHMFEVAEGYEAMFYGGVSGVTNYVPGEVPTGGRWIDGKPVYRAVFVTTLSPASDILVGKLEGVPDSVLSIVGTLQSGAGLARAISFASYSTLNWSAGPSVNASGEIHVILGSSWPINANPLRVTAIVEYTRKDKA